jgi:hypothetical protein
MTCQRVRMGAWTPFAGMGKAIFPSVTKRAADIKACPPAEPARRRLVFAVQLGIKTTLF